MFIDSVKIYAKAGNGGNGCIALLREAFRPKGGPCGGDGGKGGDIILEASHDINNLVAQYYAPRTVAKSGLPGQGKNKTGKSGAPVVIKVPCGTTVWRMVDPLAPAIEKAYQKTILIRPDHDKDEKDDIEEEDHELPDDEALKSARIRHRGTAKAMELNLEHKTIIQAMMIQPQ
jgi:GTPase involved in cell partitioning and DNA repair